MNFKKYLALGTALTLTLLAGCGSSGPGADQIVIHPPDTARGTWMSLTDTCPCLSAAICRRTTAFVCTFWMRGMCPCATPCGQAGPKTARMR